MATELKLNTEWIDDTTIRVSWVDTVRSDFHSSNGVIYGSVGLSLFIAGMIIFFNTSNPSWLWLGVIGAIFALFMWKHVEKVPNNVVLGKETTIHAGKTYQTVEITRFEYGLRSTLTGNRYDNGTADPTILRMWLNDSTAVKISENGWQFQVNHEIRAALDQALTAVRKDSKPVVQEQNHGKSGDFGVPDY
ncbi:hypothetical protein OS189_18420 [Sulfitobacter sp. F26169L]|uniref:hypothetical protein n=1 Tax=Sulfitobacter sp. F26169L TaxID=2996015 RepID=UPI0022609F17|nr:hypothetical protein [Sulfitobacter sp. F26169L]MCX7568317.1 hypothetical protein [Sulfitobacter sp. F26169L]